MAKQWQSFDFAANAAFEEWNHICGCAWKSFLETFEPMPWIFELGAFFSARENDISEQPLPGKGLWSVLPLGKAFPETSISSVQLKIKEIKASAAWLVVMTAHCTAVEGC